MFNEVEVLAACLLTPLLLPVLIAGTRTYLHFAPATGRTVRGRLVAVRDYINYNFYTIVEGNWQLFQVVISFVSAGLYVADSYTHRTTKWSPTHSLDGVLTVFFLIDYLWAFFMARNKLTHFFSFFSLIDIYSIVPYLVLTALTDLNSRSLTLRLMNGFRILRVLRSHRLLEFTKTELQRQLLVVVLTIVDFFFCFACLIQLVEDSADFPMTFDDALWFVVITSSTVGYGDIVPQTQLGRWLVIIIIFIGIVLIPLQTSKLISLQQARPKYGGSLKTSSRDIHVVVIVGSVATMDSAVTFLREFYHRDNELQDHKVVILSSSPEPSTALAALLSVPFYEAHVTYLHGSPLNASDLVRAKAATATAIFLTVDQLAAAANREDSSVILKAIALSEYVPHVRVYTQTLHRRNIGHMAAAGADVILCVDEIKMGLLAQSCLAPGLCTLITNLVRSYSDVGGTAGWTHEYTYGISQEVYVEVAAPRLSGLTFAAAAAAIYAELSAITFAVFVYVRGQPQVWLNPGHDYVIAAGDRLFIIAQSKRNLASSFFVSSAVLREQAMAARAAEADASARSRAGKSDVASARAATRAAAATHKPIPPGADRRSSVFVGPSAARVRTLSATVPSATSVDMDTALDTAPSSVGDRTPPVYVSTPTMAVKGLPPGLSIPPSDSSSNSSFESTGKNDASANAFGEDVEFHRHNIYSSRVSSINILPNWAIGDEYLIDPYSLEESLFAPRPRNVWAHIYDILPPDQARSESDVTNTLPHPRIFRNHIIVAGTHSGLASLILPLRSKRLALHPTIVLLSPKRPTKELWFVLTRFSNVFWVKGSAGVFTDLYRVNVGEAARLIVLANSENPSSDKLMLDADTIFSLRSIRHKFERSNVKIQYIAELAHGSNSRFLDPVAEDVFGSEPGLSSSAVHVDLVDNDDPVYGSAVSDYTFLSQFASGSVFTSPVIDSLLCQAFTKPFIISIVRQMLGLGKDACQCVISSQIFQINLRPEFIHLTYAQLVEFYSTTLAVIPLGLYRLEPSTGHRYVYTNPEGSVRLVSSDKVFVLSRGDVHHSIFSPDDDVSDDSSRDSDDHSESDDADPNAVRRRTSLLSNSVSILSDHHAGGPLPPEPELEEAMDSFNRLGQDSTELIGSSAIKAFVSGKHDKSSSVDPGGPALERQSSLSGGNVSNRRFSRSMIAVPSHEALLESAAESESAVSMSRSTTLPRVVSSFAAATEPSYSSSSTSPNTSSAETAVLSGPDSVPAPLPGEYTYASYYSERTMTSTERDIELLISSSSLSIDRGE
ncbi:uncharacterized protein AMSG_03581 [Thecamonas trahens ATCC 50062]|uniref:RCK N-terminal domain-containing protein n=1 Tax=Thecamonas trahens ATCC 50062 TaxID=461836 RepID=A0A0L0D782_THETB|nr:hypothetical protein AMSG_03581 [Thecamonas trahens ATCC 50062]KNC47153.1 hypothetical protein AMSG_03581 [Thecamonas trahens ATCC 50062]|eukprot:XP_013759927.1 hypothetical protein AMSG_03581 [Thecamonas trahens ATCC 50062]